jgi:hypothetical protein
MCQRTTLVVPPEAKGISPSGAAVGCYTRKIPHTRDIKPQRLKPNF